MRNELTDALASLRIERGAETPHPAPPRARRPLVLAAACAAFLAAAGAWFLAGRTHAGEGAVRVGAARPEGAGGGRPPAADLTASGWIVPVQEAVLAPRTAGRVRAFPRREGAAVRAGEVIVQIDDAEAAAQLARARAALQRAQVTVTEQRRLAAIDALLAADGALASSAAAASRSRLALAEAESRVAAAEVATAETALEGCRVRAPFDGVLARRLVEVGEVVSVAAAPRAESGVAGAVAQVVDVSELEVLVDVNETHLDRVAAGQAAEVEVAARAGRRYAARVERVDPIADRSKGSVSVRVRMLERDEGLRPQLSARVTFLSNPPPDGARLALRVPRGAVAERAGRAVVLAIEQGRVRYRPVELGASGGDHVEVRSGLDGGELLVVNPPSYLADGARVEVQP